MERGKRTRFSGWRQWQRTPHTQCGSSIPQSNANLYPESPVRSPQADAIPVEATVKWFNPEKGFGFVEIADGSGDAFLSIKALQARGKDTVSPGAKLNLFVGQGERGRQLTKIAAIDGSGTSIAPTGDPASASRPGRVEANLSVAKAVFGKVKWFSAEKGMGFVEAEDGGKDVFIHISVVKKARSAGLSECQHISTRVTETAKGRQAVSVEPIDSGPRCDPVPP
jgi:CspA family cold shock protein